jgi:hypothetical protein
MKHYPPMAWVTYKKKWKWCQVNYFSWMDSRKVTRARDKVTIMQLNYGIKNYGIRYFV